MKEHNVKTAKKRKFSKSRIIAYKIAKEIINESLDKYIKYKPV